MYLKKTINFFKRFDVKITFLYSLLLLGLALLQSLFLYYRLEHNLLKQVDSILSDETDELINKRVAGALKFGLTSILCIGETLEEREAGDTFAVLEKQTRQGLTGISGFSPDKLVIAYEPVWAIGTGRTATEAQAQEVHLFVRNLLVDIYEKNIASDMRILYGGSVKPDNVDILMAQEDVDGALVGGAALKAESFIRIINFKD